MKIGILIFGCVFYGIQLFAQQVKNDTVYELPSVEISSSRIETFTSGQKLQKIDSLSTSLFRAENLGQLLSKNSSVQVRGSSALSTISIRGTAPQHTGFFWNGFAMNGSNIGMLNLSLIPTGYFNEVKLLYGGASSLYGSGNIGGSIHLTSNPEFDNKNKGLIALTYGSFNEYGLNGNASFSSRNWSSKTSVLLKSAKNDFPFESLKGAEQRMQNNKTKQYGIIQDLYHKLKNGTLGGSFWYQYNHQEIPSSLTEKQNDTWQEDQSFRSVLSWQQSLGSANLSVKGAFFYDDLNYVDPAENSINTIDSKITTKKTSLESTFSKNFIENSSFKAGAIFINDQGESNNWSGDVLRRQLGLFAYWVQKFPSINWTIDLKLRQDFTEGYNVPFTPALGLEGKIYNNLFGKLNISRNFRVPTFNDLFWIGLGNEDLQPESSWNEEIGLVYKNYQFDRKVNGNMEITAFSSQVDNWILWVPNGSIFTPENIQKVWARGLEIEGALDFKLKQLIIGLTGGYSYTKSTNEIQQGANDASYQKQLIYIPEHRFFINTTISYKTFVFSYNYNYTGLQYVSSDNLESIPAYGLGNISLQKTFNVFKQRLTSQFEVLNIWDVEYQSNQYYPMPGRSFKFSIIMSFN